MNIFKKIWNFFKPVAKIVIKGILAIALGALKDVAIQTVTELGNGNLSNEDKRKEAFKRIKNYAITRGIDAKDSAINFAIETALQSIKGTIEW